MRNRTLRTIGYWCIALGIYGLSCISMWKYNHKAFSKGGSFEGSKPGLMIIFCTYCPVFNSVCAVAWRAMDSEYSFSNHFNVTK